MLMKKVKLFLACLLAVLSAAYAQGQQVTGTVTDQNGEPVAGVSVVVDGTTGLLCRKGDAESLARCLETLLTDASVRRRMGEAGRERYETHFRKTCFEARLLQILDFPWRIER